MNGVHDMGGNHGMGPTAHPDQPVFRNCGLTRLGDQRDGVLAVELENFRFELLQIPLRYARMPYERWSRCS